MLLLMSSDCCFSFVVVVVTVAAIVAVVGGGVYSDHNVKNNIGKVKSIHNDNTVGNYECQLIQVQIMWCFALT